MEQLYEISNFTGSCNLTVKVAAGAGKLVNVMCYAGSLELLHTMTPRQARQMADALIVCANKCDMPIAAPEI